MSKKYGSSRHDVAGLWCKETDCDTGCKVKNGDTPIKVGGLYKKEHFIDSRCPQFNEEKKCSRCQKIGHSDKQCVL